jgi:hypothetical protein
MTNKLFSVTVIAAGLLLSCKKEDGIHVPPVANPVPEMVYTNLHDSAIRYQQPVTVFYFDNDGFADLKFAVVLVGDPINQQDKRQFIVSSGIHSKLAVNTASQSPVMNKSDLIPVSDFNGYKWWLVSSVLLAQRIENINGTIMWEGDWKATVKKYLPFQMTRNNKHFSGWVELSVDITQEKVILHKLALCKEAESAIKAGQ